MGKANSKGGFFFLFSFLSFCYYKTTTKLLQNYKNYCAGKNCYPFVACSFYLLAFPVTPVCPLIYWLLFSRLRDLPTYLPTYLPTPYYLHSSAVWTRDSRHGFRRVLQHCSHAA